MNQEFAISAAALADTWRGNTDADPEHRRFCIKQYQGAAAYHAGYTAPIDPFKVDHYRTMLEVATQRVHRYHVDPADLATAYHNLAADWAQIADSLRHRRAPAYRIRSAQNLAEAYAEVATTIADPDYWIEH